ncbi:hypothetical protein Pla123a_32290 [Posidoniimonas polymericola]|uniref:Uncharacterized protein n=1 Tax=Posidoniimonas polymericola TaxID=2528002 RepID=A0A5C5YLN4_9BACT|nr:hypothetical protein [Posidoniimonas polymericola]TWT75719.1 hypothetical protein Pla123a_32290 [Posidoniimonas polymericola]
MIGRSTTTAFSVSALLLCLATLAALAGCNESGGGGKVPDASDGDMLRGVVTTYRNAARQLGRPPKDYSELEAIYAPVSSNPAEYLTSKRDGEKFVVVWGLNLATAPPDTVVAYEKVGVDGKRMLVTLDGYTREASETEINELEEKAKANR